MHSTNIITYHCGLCIRQYFKFDIIYINVQFLYKLSTISRLVLKLINFFSTNTKQNYLCMHVNFKKEKNIGNGVDSYVYDLCEIIQIHLRWSYMNSKYKS